MSDFLQGMLLGSLLFIPVGISYWYFGRQIDRINKENE